MALALQPSPKTLSAQPQAPHRPTTRANQPSRYLHLGARVRRVFGLRTKRRRLGLRATRGPKLGQPLDARIVAGHLADPAHRLVDVERSRLDHRFDVDPVARAREHRLEHGEARAVENGDRAIAEGDVPDVALDLVVER